MPGERRPGQATAAYIWKTNGREERGRETEPIDNRPPVSVFVSVSM